MDKYLIISSVIILSLILITCIGEYITDKYIICPKFAATVNLPYKYDWIAGGCFVKYNGQWIPSDNFGGVQIKQ